MIRIDFDLVKTSCGYGVPFFEYTGERDTLDRWAEAKGRRRHRRRIARRRTS